MRHHIEEGNEELQNRHEGMISNNHGEKGWGRRLDVRRLWKKNFFIEIICGYTENPY